MSKLVVVQRQVSQLDEPVYARLHELVPGICQVVYWNDYGFERARPDPEMGIVPDLRDGLIGGFPKQWLDSQSQDWRQVAAAVAAAAPSAVLLMDLPRLQRLVLAQALRLKGIKAGLRTDKNALSPQHFRGAKLALERQTVLHGFDFLAPVSPLTAAYYRWPRSRRSLHFPYASNERKFDPPADLKARLRRQVRTELGIADTSQVFLTAAKFSERENPLGVIKAFAALAGQGADVALIALGAGPLLKQTADYASERAAGRVVFPGFVPFQTLQRYFFAADTFVHDVSPGPWEVSPQDALVAGLSVIAGRDVGSGQVFLTESLERFRVPHADVPALTAAMAELVHGERNAELFAPARQRALDYTVGATAARVGAFLQTTQTCQ